MTTRILATLALLGLMSSANAVRTIGQPERPYEVALSQLILPSSTSGNLIVRACATCRVNTHRLADGARFLVDGRELPFAEFLKAVNELRGSPTASARTVVGVFVDVAAGRVNRLEIYRPRG
jgi:hypothetical protein